MYTTPVARARRRVARGLATLRNLPPEFDGAGLEPLRAADVMTPLPAVTDPALALAEPAADAEPTEEAVLSSGDRKSVV